MAAGRCSSSSTSRDAGPGRLAPLLGPLDVPPRRTRATRCRRRSRARAVSSSSAARWARGTTTWRRGSRRPGGCCARATAAGLPVLGVCLGAQLLAMACGGRASAAAPDEVGLSARPRAAGGRGRPAARRCPRRDGAAPRRRCLRTRDFVAPQYHHDAITRAAAGRRACSRSATRYPHQVFRVGERAWGVQYHPEVTTRTSRRGWRRSQRHLIAAGHEPRRGDASVTSASRVPRRCCAGTCPRPRPSRAIRSGDRPVLTTRRRPKLRE